MRRSGTAHAIAVAWTLLGARAAADDARATPAQQANARVQLLGLNDFHGQLGPGKSIAGRPVGSAPVLASYLREQTARFPGATLIVHAGDWVGASPPTSALLQDEPAIQFLNLLANEFCTPTRRMHPRCDVVGTPGNHEFDEGVAELLRLVRGGASPRGPFLEHPYRGAHFPYVSANVVDARSGATILPPYVIKEAGGVRLAVIGAVLEATPSMVVADGVRGVRFLNEAQAIQRAVAKVRRAGVEAIVVTIHQGGEQVPYEGPTRPDAQGPSGAIAEIVARLDDAVDVVISGHAHAFTNALMRSAHGREILVVQALSAGMAYSSVELEIDRQSGDVVKKSAQVIPTYADAGPGLTPAADVSELVARAEQLVGPRLVRVVGTAQVKLSETPNEAGESALGDLIADAHRKALGAEIGFMNQGGIRAGLDAGPITWGELFAIHPFGNVVVGMDLTGAQVLSALEQQWVHTPARVLQVSGLSYVWDPQRPAGARVISASVGGRALDPHASYRVAVNSFLASGGGGFGVFARGKQRKEGPVDLDALTRYIEALGAPVANGFEGRIRVGSSAQP